MAMTFARVTDGVYRLDVNGYVCPHPQIYTKKALEKLQSGDVLEVLFDNPSSGESIIAMVDNDGNELVEQEQDDGQFKWRIQKT
jgi:tRNA 2-thiouridine synthesizing protein A